MPALTVTTLAGIPMVRPGDSLGDVIGDALARNDLRLRDGDIVVVAQKIVSKAEDRQIALADVEPGAEARQAVVCKRIFPMFLLHSVVVALPRLVTTQPVQIAYERPSVSGKLDGRQ